MLSDTKGKITMFFLKKSSYLSRRPGNEALEPLYGEEWLKREQVAEVLRPEEDHRVDARRLAYSESEKLEAARVVFLCHDLQFIWSLYSITFCFYVSFLFQHY